MMTIMLDGTFSAHALPSMQSSNGRGRAAKKVFALARQRLRQPVANAAGGKPVSTFLIPH
jgi:hypothetical protein